MTAEDCSEDHLEILEKGVVTEVVEVEADFVGERSLKLEISILTPTLLNQ